MLTMHCKYCMSRLICIFLCILNVIVRTKALKLGGFMRLVQHLVMSASLATS